ncbi:MAG: transposase [Candidatus Binatia bacterium]
MGNKKHGKRYRVEQIIPVLRQLESGKPIAELCRTYGVGEATIHRWRTKYGQMTESEAHRLRELEAENARLKRIVADQAMDNATLKELLAKNW